MRHRVELDELLTFVERLQSFEQRAETIASRVEQQVAALHDGWSGDAAAAHRAQHDEWMASSHQMREALGQLRAAAHNAHRNYSEAGQLNLDMLR